MVEITQAPKGRFELFVELIKAASWPVIALLLLFSFWGPIHDAANLIPSIMMRSDTITIAGLSLKVSPELRERASPEVQKVLTQLSPQGLDRILQMSESSFWDIGSETNGRNENQNLLQLGLVEEIPSAELEAHNHRENRNFGFGVRITSLGRQTQIFLRSVLSRFVNEVAQQGESTSK
jgi:hypothetical protein